MKVGVGLPGTIPGVDGNSVIEWAREAEEKGFSTIAALDRIVYPNFEPLMSLSAAAAVTRRVRLMATVIVAPARQTVLLAKQAATLDKLSSGRLTLGVGVGGRMDDFEATGASFKTRGRRVEEQLALMKRIWSGERVSDRVGPVGPAPSQNNGPELLVGGSGNFVGARVAKFADGYISGGSPPELVTPRYMSILEKWKEKGRQGRPRLVGSAYFALGADASSRGAAYIRHYYSFLGAATERVLRGLVVGEMRVKSVLDSFGLAGADEVIFWPTIPDIEQLDLLKPIVQE